MTKERLGSLILLLIGIYAAVSAVRLPIGDWRQPGPGLFPLLLSLLLCVVSILLFIFHGGTEKIDWPGLRKRMTQWQIVLLTAGFIFAMPRIGYLTTSFLYLFGMLFWVCRLRFWISIALSLVIGLGIWYFFGTVLGLHLPTGPWRF